MPADRVAILASEEDRDLIVRALRWYASDGVPAKQTDRKKRAHHVADRVEQADD